MAKSAGFPGEVIDEAHAIIRELSSEENEHAYDSVIDQARNIATRRQAVLSVRHHNILYLEFILNDA